MDHHLIKVKKTNMKFKIIKNKKDLTSKEINQEMIRIQKINLINKYNILILHIMIQEQVHCLIIL
jgi:protease II